MNLLIFY